MKDATNITLGNGAAPVTLSAGGDIRISNRSDAGDLAEDFGNFAGMGMDWSGFDERISRRVEQAASRAQRKADEVIRRAENKVRDAGRVVLESSKEGLRSGVGVGILHPRVCLLRQDQRFQMKSVSVILKMLQEKKISAEDAEKLLSALEGGS